MDQQVTRSKPRSYTEDYKRQAVGLVVSSGRGRVARPFGSALTDPGRRLSRTRLFPEVTRIMPHVVSMGG